VEVTAEMVEEMAKKIVDKQFGLFWVRSLIRSDIPPISGMAFCELTITTWGLSEIRWSAFLLPFLGNLRGVTPFDTLNQQFLTPIPLVLTPSPRHTEAISLANQNLNPSCLLSSGRTLRLCCKKFSCRVTCISFSVRHTQPRRYHDGP